jgi:hypothetical protein
MDDKEIMARIGNLIDTEHELRGQLARGELSSEQERERLRSAEEALDQCWDLLRQRRAKREFGDNPDVSEARPVSEVEHYQQLCPYGPSGDITEATGDFSNGGFLGILRPVCAAGKKAVLPSSAQPGGIGGTGGRPSEDDCAKEHRAYREVRQG